jgi:hypothetical protein
MNLIKIKKHKFEIPINNEFCFNIQGDSYSFIHILTIGRFRSQKALNNKILIHTYIKNWQKLPHRFFRY